MSAHLEPSVLRGKQSLPLIDMLRGFAALWVVLFHVRVDLWVGFQEIHAHPGQYHFIDRFLSVLSIPAFFGGSGVMLFFLVSGFCIHLPHVGERRVSWREYLTRRFWRIYPPYLAAVGLTVACEMLAVRYFEGKAISSTGIVIQTVLMGQNYASNGAQLAGNPSLWSLPVEVELYLVYPLFLLLLDRYGMRTALGVVAVLSMIATGAYLAGHPFLHNNFAHYWLIWCAGAWLADGWRRDQLPHYRWWFLALFVAAAILGCWLRLQDVSFAIQNYAWAAAYFVLLLIGLTRPGGTALVPKIVEDSLAQVGVFSYSLYLVHFPIFVLAGAAWSSTFGTKPVSFLIPLGAVLITVPIAWLFYRCTELPSLRVGRDLARRRFSPLPARV